MSLCPNYCECRTCKHGIKVCDDICSDCREEAERQYKQELHEISVRNQRKRIKVMHRKEDSDAHS